MPKITNPNVLRVLQDKYFAHHVAMHLARERVKVSAEKEPRRLILPSAGCKDCLDMIPVGDKGSGRQFLEMHHEMIQVFRFLLKDKLGAEWKGDHWETQPNATYSPTLWDLDDWTKLPQEIRGMFSQTDRSYLREVFDGVKQRTAGNRKPPEDQIDELGKFIERGAPPGQSPDGAGFHNTLHEFLGSREGRAAAGAEMNNLMNARNNDYFWSLHLWIDAQYGRMLTTLKQPFEVSALNPADAKMTKPMAHRMKGVKPRRPRRAAPLMAKGASQP